MASDIAGFRQMVADLLKDGSNATWSEDEMEAAIRLALADLSRRLPRPRSADLILTYGGREVSLAPLGDCLWVEEAWWPYDDGSYPPCVAPFVEREGRLSLRTVVEPAPGDMVHLLYAGMQAISGLDGAEETTVPQEWEGVLALGAAGYAALAKAAAMSREFSWPEGAAANVSRWGRETLDLFREKLREARPAAARAWVSWG